MRQAKTFLMAFLLVGPASLAKADEGKLRVLILGDNVYSQAPRTVAKQLELDVVWKHPGDTSTALQQIDKLLGEGKWDVIHFNFGLADLHYKDPSTKAVRALSKHAGGVRVTSAESYERNLPELVKRLKLTNARLIWASTTPIPSTQYDEIYDPGSEVQFNAIAAKVMAQQGVKINDMHGYVTKYIGKVKRASLFGSKELPLHPPIADSIRKELNDLPGTVSKTN